ncbi:MAG: HAMP domain-containing histidine kinase, partial [Deltaproteobacteria bacterium]|nr:HAMP domain-containing histidine kinase [Deltaproteobacteria bacterium]
AVLAKSGGKEDSYGRKVDVKPPADDAFRPVRPRLDLARERIRSRPAEAEASELRADPIARQAVAKLMPILLDAQRTNLAGVRILDAHGIVTGGREDVGKSLAHLSEVKSALEGNYSSAIRRRTIRRPQPALASISRGTGVRVFVAYPITEGERLFGVILLSRTPASILEHLYGQKEKVALAAAMILLMVIVLAVLTSYSIARPLHGLVAQTKRFAGGDKKALEPLTAPVTEEVALLSQSFAEMARSLEHRSEYIRDFAAHVSHEFKTPLTAIQGAIELLEEHSHDMPAEQRATFLKNIALDARRLKRLVDRLLEMARADVLDPAAGKTALAPTIEGLRDRYRDVGLSISYSGDEHCTAKIVPEVLEMILSNLLDNSRQNGAQSVEIAVGRNGGMIAARIADDGQGISPANAKKIFTPFFTTQRDEGGTGLGLGIVRSLLKAYGGDIEHAGGNKGATFVLKIPAVTNP